MLTKFNAVQAYEKIIEKLLEYEDVYNIPHLDGEELHQYEHLKSMSEYLIESLKLGATEVLLNIVEVNSLVKEVE